MTTEENNRLNNFEKNYVIGNEKERALQKLDFHYYRILMDVNPLKNS